MARSAASNPKDTTCRYCGKVLKTSRGRTLHERTCPKAEDSSRPRGPSGQDAPLDAQLQRLQAEEAGLRDLSISPESEAPVDWDFPPHSGPPRLEDELREMRTQLGRKADTDALDGVLGRGKDLVKRIDVLDDKASSITTTLGEFTARALAKFHEMEGELETRAMARDVSNLATQLEKVREKLDQLMEETGYGAVMDIGKIPPHILESVYQTTIDDVLRELRKTIGAHDTELLIQKAKEDVRARTSGSELFHFDPPHLLVKGLARSIEKGLLSARQIHTTYQELLGKLREPVPNYRPRNFRALLKVKSQEYAVDRSTSLSESIGDMKAMVREAADAAAAARAGMEENIAELGSQVDALSVKLEEVRDLPERVRELEDRLKAMEARAPAEDDAARDVLRVLPEDGCTAKRAFKELKGTIPEDAVIAALDELVARGEVERASRGRWTVFKPSVAAPAPPAEEEAPLSVDELEEGPRAVFDAVGRQGHTLSGLQSALKDEMKYTDMLKALRILLDGGLLTTVTRGRHTVYVRTDAKEAERNA